MAIFHSYVSLPEGKFWIPFIWQLYLEGMENLEMGGAFCSSMLCSAGTRLGFVPKKSN
jgi:hypothetical protein